MKQRLEKKISKLKSENLYRDIKPAVAKIDFSKNDYLGLSRSKSVAKALKDAVDQYGISSTSAQTIGGFTIAHEEFLVQDANLPCSELEIYSEYLKHFSLYSRAKRQVISKFRV